MPSYTIEGLVRTVPSTGGPGYGELKKFSAFRYVGVATPPTFKLNSIRIAHAAGTTEGGDQAWIGLRMGLRNTAGVQPQASVQWNYGVRGTKSLGAHPSGNYAINARVILNTQATYSHYKFFGVLTTANV